jgi:putative PIN family toxin of toxin-antitoxin system
MDVDPRPLPRVVIDTTTFFRSMPRLSQYRPIFEAFRDRRFLIIVSNEILLEYEEVLKERRGPHAWAALSQLFQDHADHVERVDPSFHWNVIDVDPDDNKFVDAAVAGGAEWIVTDDRHYRALDGRPEIGARPLDPLDFIDQYC